MKGLFIPEITAEMFRNGCLESIETLMAEGEIYDIEYDPKSAQPEQKKGRWVPGREIGKEILTDGTAEVVYEDYKCSSCGLILYRLLHNSDGTPFLQVLS